MLKLIAALILSVGLWLADRHFDLGRQLENAPALMATVHERLFPAPKPTPIGRPGEKHFDTFCACDAY